MESPKLVREKLYVHAGTFAEFQRYAKANIDYDCEYIVDDNTLRGKQPGRVIRIDTYQEKWNDQAIEESIQTALEQWEANAPQGPIQTNEDGEDMTSYGVS